MPDHFDVARSTVPPRTRSEYDRQGQGETGGREGGLGHDVQGRTNVANAQSALTPEG